MTPPGRWGACGTPHELTMIAPLQRGRHHTLEGKRLKRPHFGRSTPYLVASPTSRDLTDRNQPSSGRSLDKRGREHPWSLVTTRVGDVMAGQASGTGRRPASGGGGGGGGGDGGRGKGGGREGSDASGGGRASGSGAGGGLVSSVTTRRECVT